MILTLRRCRWCRRCLRPSPVCSHQAPSYLRHSRAENLPGTLQVYNKIKIYVIRQVTFNAGGFSDVDFLWRHVLTLERRRGWWFSRRCRSWIQCWDSPTRRRSWLSSSVPCANNKTGTVKTENSSVIHSVTLLMCENISLLLGLLGGCGCYLLWVGLEGVLHTQGEAFYVERRLRWSVCCQGVIRRPGLFHHQTWKNRPKMSSVCQG